MEAATATHFRSGVQEDLYVRIREYCGTDVAAFHYDATGCPEVKWLAPVRPGDRLRVRMKVLDTRASRSRPDLGFADVRFDMFNAQELPVMTLTSHLMLGRRTNDAPP